MIVSFPYDNVAPLELSDDTSVDFFDLPGGAVKTGGVAVDDARFHQTSVVREAAIVRSPDSAEAAARTAAIVCESLQNPIGTPTLRELTRGKSRVLVVVDDNSRPTPVTLFVMPGRSDSVGAGPAIGDAPTASDAPLIAVLTSAARMIHNRARREG